MLHEELMAELQRNCVLRLSQTFLKTNFNCKTHIKQQTHSEQHNSVYSTPFISHADNLPNRMSSDKMLPALTRVFKNQAKPVVTAKLRQCHDAALYLNSSTIAIAFLLTSGVT